ncbi:MAG: DNA/RNA non-specific endonuclease [Bacteroidales bacterium]|nr:DNA/RNA non-specific endonuclease [Bacteroidales bacterium]
MKTRLLAARLFVALAASAFVFASCDDDDDPDVVFGYGSGSSTTPSSSANAQYTSRLEVPALKEGNLFLQHSTLEGSDSVMTYSLEYDKTKRHSRWVAFRFDEKTRPKTVARKSYDAKPQYPCDPLVPSAYALSDDISFNGYDHGHLCASADRLYSREANDNTFYLTNMSPQIDNFNQNFWTAFESYVQTKGRDASFADTLYVVKGGTIDSEDNILNYVCNYTVPVPKYYYMALLKVKNNTYSAMAFLMEHKNYGNETPSNSEMAEYITSIDELESFTGIDFFHNLLDRVEDVVESAVAPSAWGF